MCDTHKQTIEVDGKTAVLDVWNTEGQEEFCNMRQTAYPQTDAFILCFSLTNHESCLLMVPLNDVPPSIYFILMFNS